MLSSSAFNVAGGASSSEMVPAAEPVSYCCVEAQAAIAANAVAATTVVIVRITSLPCMSSLRFCSCVTRRLTGNWYTEDSAGRRSSENNYLLGAARRNSLGREDAGLIDENLPRDHRGEDSADREHRPLLVRRSHFEIAEADQRHRH